MSVVTLKTLGNKQNKWICRKRSHLCTNTITAANIIIFINIKTINFRARSEYLQQLISFMVLIF